MRRAWTLEEIEYLSRNYTSLSYEEIAQKLGRSYQAITTKLKKLGLKLSIEEWNKRKIEALKEVNNDSKGSKNHNWKGGVSKDNYRYKCIQKDRFPEKIKARQIVGNAVRSGKIIKGVCSVCGSSETFAHHDDYSKPLSVIWLCRKHHRELHNNRH